MVYLCDNLHEGSLYLCPRLIFGNLLPGLRHPYGATRAPAARAMKNHGALGTKLVDAEVVGDSQAMAPGAGASDVIGGLQL